MAGESIGLLLRTVRHLKPRQVVNRFSRRWAVSPRLAGAPPQRREGACLARPTLEARDSFLGDHRFRFLNEERRVPPEAYGEPKGGLLWDYNFHYFDGLAGRSPDPAQKREWISEWLRRVPVGSRPAWDPYPTSRRILNWIVWAMTSEAGLPEGAAESLAAQARHLQRTLEFHLMANHLLANAVALTGAGVWFGGREGDRWLARGSRLLERELREQYHPDGGHYELSPIYHAAILRDLLDLIQISRAVGVAVVAARLESPAKRASVWLTAMTRPDGRVFLTNDAAYDQGPDPHGLLRYAEDVLGVAASSPEPGLTLLESSGYFRFSTDRLFVIGDVGQIGPAYQPGHGHCDMLSFGLCWEGRPIIVDTGTSTYEVGPRRTLERGTSAHNTVQIGGTEQSEIWAGFRVARRASVEALEVEGDRLSARIRAFPEAWSTVERSWTFLNETVRVRDRILETQRPDLPRTARLHFHPEVALRREEGGWLADGLQIGFEGATAVREVEYSYAPEFNRRLPARCLEIDFDRQLLTVIRP